MGACTYYAFPASETLASPAAPLVGIFIFTNTGSVGPCGFLVSFEDSWVSAITINGPNSQSFFAVAQNLGPPRSTNIVVTDNGGGGVLLIPVTQGSNGCSYALDPTSLSLSSAAHPSQLIQLTTGGTCGWDVTCPDPWVTIDTPSGTAGGFVSISISANAGAGRNTIVTIGGIALPVAQAGSSCSYAVSPSSLSIGADGGFLSTAITTSPGCAWTPTGPPAWITLPGGPGTGIGTIEIVVASNTGSTSPRVGTFVVGGQTVTVTQAGGPGGGFAVPDPDQIFCVNGVTRPFMRDNIRRMMGVTPPHDTLPLAIIGEPPMGQPTPTNAEINQAITDAIRWVNDKSGMSGSTVVNISVPATTANGVQFISLTGVGAGSGSNQNNVNTIQKAVWNPGDGASLIPLYATDAAELDRLGYAWDNYPPAIPRAYMVERYQLGILPAAQTAGTLQLYAGLSVYEFCGDTDVLNVLPVDYELVLEQLAVLFLSQRRPSEPGATARIQFLGGMDGSGENSGQVAAGIKMIRAWYNDTTVQQTKSIGMVNLRRSYGKRRIRR